MLEQVRQRILGRLESDGFHKTIVPGMGFYSTTSEALETPLVYQPSVCLVLQGRKQAMVEDALFSYAFADYLLVSVDLPLVGKVLEASPEKPFLSLSLDIDLALMSELVVQRGLENRSVVPSKASLFVGKVDEAMADCVARYVRLLDYPADLAVLEPLLKREFHYRLLTGDHGSTIAQMASHGTNMARIAKVIETMRRDISKPIRLEDLAGMANMSLSSFHAHFKKMTLMSPLQFYKRLRLTTARHIMLSEGTDATSTAYRVGYQSPSQFSREYARMFGSPPMRDIEGLRL